MKFFGLGKKEEEGLKSRNRENDNPMDRSTIKVGEIEN
jgi:hypothetical protein